MRSYYNEWNGFAAQWLRNLIAAGLLPDGDVDERSIADVQPSDLTGYTQCHFFAGIGGWALGLELAGWPSDASVWTGSCPCQPFSQAGKGVGTSDPRHLWPEFRRLIEVCRPSVVFGEQVAGTDGRDWLAGVRVELEAMDYAVGAADLCAAGVGAPHIRSRFWWVAEGGMGNADEPRSQGWRIAGNSADERVAGSAGLGYWDDAESIPCLDGKSRRIEPGVATLVNGFPRRDDQLRAYGNAIVPQVAAQFVKAYLDDGGWVA